MTGYWITITQIVFVKVEAENRDLRRHLEALEQEISQANDSQRKLDELVVTGKENEFSLRRRMDELKAENEELQEEVKCLNSRT